MKKTYRITLIAALITILFLGCQTTASNMADSLKNIPPVNLNSYFPMRIGYGNQMMDPMGAAKIVAGAKETIEGKEYIRIDRSSAMLGNYQSEFVFEKDGNIYEAGRKIFDNILMFEEPYMILKSELKAGDSWEGIIKIMGRTETTKFTVEGKETVKTNIGDLKAIKVSQDARLMKVTRWYSKGIGLVKEESRGIKEDSPINTKVLMRIVTPDMMTLEENFHLDRNAVNPGALYGLWFIAENGMKVTIGKKGRWEASVMDGAQIVRGGWKLEGLDLKWSYDEAPDEGYKAKRIVDFSNDRFILKDPEGNFSEFIRIREGV